LRQSTRSRRDALQPPRDSKATDFLDHGRRPRVQGKMNDLNHDALSDKILSDKALPDKVLPDIEAIA
jgi:hypothetical protein